MLCHLNINERCFSFWAACFLTIYQDSITVTVPKFSHVLQQSKPCCLNVDLEPIVTSSAHDSRYFSSLFCDRRLMEYNFLCSFSSIGVHISGFILYTYCILHKTVIRLWWLVCHSFVIWFQFCGFQLHQAWLHIGFHIWLQRNLFRFLWPAWHLGTHTVTILLLLLFFIVTLG